MCKMSFVFKPFHQNVRCFRSYVNLDNFNSQDLSMLDYPSGGIVVCDDENLYLFGGFNLDLLEELPLPETFESKSFQLKPLFRKDVWKYNISKEIWTKLIIKNVPYLSGTGTFAFHISGHLLMLYGSRDELGSYFFICDLRKESPSFSYVKTRGSKPPSRFHISTLLINNYFYTISGGSFCDYSCNIYRLDISCGKWEVVYQCKGKEFEPPRRYQYTKVLDDNKFIFLGGMKTGIVDDFKNIYTFDISTLKWECILTKPDPQSYSNYPTPRGYSSCVKYDRYVYVIGGFFKEIWFREIWRLNLDAYQWQYLSNFSLFDNTFTHSSCVTSSGKLITFGSILPMCENVGDNTFSLCCINTGWICVPKLEDICWDALLFYVKKEKLTDDQILNLGLPEMYIQKLEIDNRL